MITKHFTHYNRDFYFILNNEKDESDLIPYLEKMSFPLNSEVIYIVEFQNHININYFIAYKIKGELYWSSPFEKNQSAASQLEGFIEIEGQVIDRQILLKYEITVNCNETIIYLLDELCEINVSGGLYVRVGPLLVIKASIKNQIIECKWNDSKLIDVYSKSLLIPLSFHLSGFKLKILNPLFSNYRKGMDYNKIAICLSNITNEFFIEYKEKEIKYDILAIPKSNWLIDEELYKILQFYEKKFGSLNYLIIITNDSILANAISYSNLIVVKPILTKHMTNFLFEYLPHEVGHQWFGINTIFTGKNAYEITEGLVEYLQLLYLKDRFGTIYFYKRRAWYEKQFHQHHLDRKNLSRYVLKWDDIYHYLGDSLFYTLLKTILKYKEFNCEDLENKMNIISKNLDGTSQ